MALLCTVAACTRGYQDDVNAAALSVIHFSVKFNKEIGLQKLFRTTQLKTLEERLNLFITWGFYLGIYVLTLVILIIFYR